MGRGRCHKVSFKETNDISISNSTAVGLCPKKGGTVEVTSHFVKLFKTLSCNKTAKGAASFALLKIRRECSTVPGDRGADYSSTERLHPLLKALLRDNWLLQSSCFKHVRRETLKKYK